MPCVPSLPCRMVHRTLSLLCSLAVLCNAIVVEVDASSRPTSRDAFSRSASCGICQKDAGQGRDSDHVLLTSCSCLRLALQKVPKPPATPPPAHIVPAKARPGQRAFGLSIGNRKNLLDLGRHGRKHLSQAAGAATSTAAFAKAKPVAVPPGAGDALELGSCRLQGFGAVRTRHIHVPCRCWNVEGCRGLSEQQSQCFAARALLHAEVMPPSSVAVKAMPRKPMGAWALSCTALCCPCTCKTWHPLL